MELVRLRNKRRVREQEKRLLDDQIRTLEQQLKEARRLERMQLQLAQNDAVNGNVPMAVDAGQQHQQPAAPVPAQPVAHDDLLE